jgi:hypothetical protein
VHSQLSVFRKKHGRHVLYTHARATRNDDDVDISLKGFENSCGIVANQAREVDKPSVSLDERSKHWAVGIRNLKAAWEGPGGKQLISGYG